jgi:hypothetical protein
MKRDTELLIGSIFVVQGISSILKFVTVVKICILIHYECSKTDKGISFQNNAYINFYNETCLAIKGKKRKY